MTDPIVTHINRRSCKRDRPLEVLVPGLSRTGTDSMRAALKILGYGDVYHGMDIAFRNPEDVIMWEEALDAEYFGKGKEYTREDWDQLLGHCTAATEFPTSLFITDLASAYPSAKVILTTRPIDAWHTSVLHSVEAARHSLLFTLINLCHPSGRLFHFKAWRIWDVQWEGNFKENGKRIFREHEQRVKEICKGQEERLLVFEVGDGWEKLCKFLGKEIPDMPFPRGNAMKEFEEMTRRYHLRRMKETGWKVFVGLGGAALVAFGAFWMVQKSKLS